MTKLAPGAQEHCAAEYITKRQLIAVRDRVGTLTEEQKEQYKNSLSPGSGGHPAPHRQLCTAVHRAHHRHGASAGDPRGGVQVCGAVVVLGHPTERSKATVDWYYRSFP